MTATTQKAAQAEEAPSALGRELDWKPPGPGSWVLDGAHCDKPRTRAFQQICEAAYGPGFRAGFERLGALLETIECKHVNGYIYLQPRPVGAPPDAKGPPPKWIFKMLTFLHPALRRRVRQAQGVLDAKPWRGDVEEFEQRWWPEIQGRLLQLTRAELGSMGTDALIEHCAVVDALAREVLREHFRQAASTMIPTGDLLAHVKRWTGDGVADAFAALRGASPGSTESVQEMALVLEAIDADDRARARLEDTSRLVGETLSALTAMEGPVGAAVEAWLEQVGERIVTGYDLAERRAIEVPGVLVAGLRAGLDREPFQVDEEARGQAERRLREKVPAEHRDTFDELLAEARLVYRLRDARAKADFWALGLVRRALLEVGRRLTEEGKLSSPEHGVYLTIEEAASLLSGGSGPSAREIDEEIRWRREAQPADVPLVLGPPPGDPPPPEWLPAAAARLADAVGTYVSMMQGEIDEPAASTFEVRGVPAARGRYVGTARVVCSHEDFERIQPGDVLIARLTSPTYNVLLPLLGALVTDRGGVLSHPAIVAREFGIPGVVGTKVATSVIPDGARVEVDGDTGIVRVLS